MQNNLNNIKHRYIYDQRSNKHYAHLPISKDEQCLTNEDSEYGDALRSVNDPSSTWSIGDQFRERGYSPEDYNVVHRVYRSFPPLPVGDSVPIVGSFGCVIFRNGVVINRAGEVLTARQRPNNNTQGRVNKLKDNGDMILSQWSVTVPLEDGNRKEFRVAELMLFAFGGEPPPSKDHVIWFKDNDLLNFSLDNLRWVHRTSLRKLMRSG